MNTKGQGIGEKSQIVFCSPSDFAKENLYYPVCAGHFYCFDGYSVLRRDYRNILIMTVVSGTCFIETGGQKFSAHQNDTVILNCSEPHSYYCKAPMETLWIHIKGAETLKLFKKISEMDCPVIKNSGGREKELIESALNSLLTPEKANETEVSILIYEILLNLMMRKSDGEKSANTFICEKAKKIITERYCENLTIECIANEVHLSASHFSKVFKEQTGFSPYDFLLKTRLRAAKNLLLTTDDLVSAVAARVGFNSDANFIYFFKNNEGLSPHKFRKLNF